MNSSNKVDMMAYNARCGLFIFNHTYLLSPSRQMSTPQCPSRCTIGLWIIFCVYILEPCVSQCACMSPLYGAMDPENIEKRHEYES